MDALENQIGESEPTRIAPWNWIELQREQARYRRRINARELVELVALALVAGALCWVI